MITREKIDEWIDEVRERPASAPNILRYIAQRLSDLTERNEALLNENISLRLGQKAEEYESRITALEYQLEILKRQIGSGEIPADLLQSPAAAPATLSLLVYNGLGQVLRLELKPSDLGESRSLARISSPVVMNSFLPRLLITSTQEEMLFVFDSGRAVTAPVTAIPSASLGEMDWEQAFVQEPRGSEELAAILPFAKMTLAELCIQTSRRGYIKKMGESFFESCVANTYVGTGTKQKQDKTFSLLFCGKNDLFVLASKEGRSFSMEANKLPLAIEQVFQMSATDHIVATFITSKKPYLLHVTNNGKAVYRAVQWLEQANTFKSQGQPIFSKARRASGTWVAGAAAVDEKDWGAALNLDGSLNLYQVNDLFENGTLGMTDVVDFVIYGT